MLATHPHLGKFEGIPEQLTLAHEVEVRDNAWMVRQRLPIRVRFIPRDPATVVQINRRADTVYSVLAVLLFWSKQQLIDLALEDSP